MVNKVFTGILLIMLSPAVLTVAEAQSSLSSSQVNANEFAPGYPEYTVQATDQLKAFPLPGYPRKNKLNRNFPWMDIRYLSREMPGRGGLGVGALKPEKSVELTDELCRNWNYYIDIPVLRLDSNQARGIYSDPRSMEYALIQYANKHPEFPLSTITYHPQLDARQAGFEKRNYIRAQDMPDSYYLSDKSKKPIVFNNQKWYSPLAPLDYIEKDALTTRMYVRQLTKFLKRPIDFINENDETYGHKRTDSLLRSDPAVLKHMNSLGLDNARYNGWYQGRLESTYKNIILKEPALKKTKFSFYNVSSVQAFYWSDYGMRRNSNSWFKGQHYSTPSFYPNYPANWERATGPMNGYGVIADGRSRELAYGDKYFSPFVSAGYKFEEDNIRPAQWLALLKSMTMLGADFFYVGYFNVTGGGKWPNGFGPFDPRGYIYQAAMPGYAQAIASRFTDFIENGTLINPRTEQEYLYRFRFYAEASDKQQLIMVRKSGNRYLLYGSIQPVTNKTASIPFKKNVAINVDGSTIKFEIRKQGSIYILDLSDKKTPVFYQLDGWHGVTHPFYWTQDFILEGELPDNSIAKKPLLLTETTGGGLDFTGFTTALVCKAGGQVAEYDFSPRKNKTLYCFIRAKTQGNKPGTLQVRSSSGTGSVKVSNSKWEYIRVKSGLGSAIKISAIANTRNTIRLSATSGTVLLDKVVLSENPDWRE